MQMFEDRASQVIFTSWWVHSLEPTGMLHPGKLTAGYLVTDGPWKRWLFINMAIFWYLFVKFPRPNSIVLGPVIAQPKVQFCYQNLTKQKNLSDASKNPTIWHIKKMVSKLPRPFIALISMHMAFPKVWNRRLAAIFHQLPKAPIFLMSTLWSDVSTGYEMAGFC